MAGRVSNLGRIHSPESRLNMSRAHIGHKPSEETKRKISNALLGHPFWGNRTHVTSDETKRKISHSNTGKTRSDEAKHKMSIWIRTPETCEKLRLHRLTQVFPNRDTKIELAVRDGLKKRGIAFKTHQVVIGQHQCDLFIEPNIVVECDGDYWHANPAKYPDDAIMIRGQTAKSIRSDNDKLSERITSSGLLLLRFWESEINSNADAIIDKIEDIVISNRLNGI